MKLYEFQGKELFGEYGIPIPKGNVVASFLEFAKIEHKIDLPVMVKAQILQGGRGKAGGIKRAETPQQLQEQVHSFLSNTLKNEKIKYVLMEEAVEIIREFYLGITVDDILGAPVVIACADGGVDIEEMANKYQEKIIRYSVDVGEGLRQHKATEIAKQLNLSGKTMVEMASIIFNLYQLFINCDAQVVEINPLILTNKEQFVAADAKVLINDDAMFRQKRFSVNMLEEFSENKYEALARSKGHHFIDMDGEIGIVSIGAGFGMMVLDVIAHFGGRPANYIDVIGGITKEGFSDIVDIVITKANEDPNVKAIFASCGLGATSLDSLVRGIVDALEKRPSRVPIVACFTADGPAVARLSLQEAEKILANAGVYYYAEFHNAIENVIRLARSGVRFDGDFS